MATGENRLRPVNGGNKVMLALQILFILGGIVLCIILCIKVFTFKEGPLQKYLTPKETDKVIIPSRGDILDCKGRIIATSTKVYSVHMDCMAPDDTVWANGIDGLCRELAACFKDRSAASYKEMLSSARKGGRRYLSIRDEISQSEILRVRMMPIFKKGLNSGGYIEKWKEKRVYPYGSSAERTIGYVKSNSDNGQEKKKKGIEGSFDNYLHGENGHQVYRRSDYGMIPVADKENKTPKDGYDIQCTLDMDIQNISENALRRIVEQNDLIEQSCVIVLERKSGAVRAMVNLGRNSKGEIGEWDNYAIRNSESPGSVFKGAVIMAMLEEGYLTTMETKIPTYGGKWKYKNRTFDDTKHLNTSRFPSGYIKVKEAFEMSANNPFSQLICDPNTFDNNPNRFIDKVREFGLLDTIKFDIKGNTVPFILTPQDRVNHGKGTWDKYMFPRMAVGYGMEIPPLNIVTFYNAIANDGKLMKPYLIEKISDGKKTIEQFGPVVMRESICRTETADTLKKVMSRVTESKNGTAYWQLHGAICPIAGKTGTAQRIFRMSNGRYGFHDEATGEESQQGTFVGFFPVNNPEYTAIVVIWCKPAKKNFFGATYAAPVFREIADKIYCLNDFN